MDKITHQVRTEYWSKIMNVATVECLKLPGTEQMGFLKSSSSTNRGFCTGTIRMIQITII